MRRATLLAACLLFGAALGTARAGSLGVGPTLIELTAKKPVAVLNVRNTGDAPTIVQLELLAWNQQAGGDEYLPTEDLAATPEVFELAPGAQREIRVGVRSTQVPDAERSYRVYVREVQPQGDRDAPQLSFAVRIGVPVFVSRAGRQGQGQVSWQLVPGEGACQRLSVRNDAPFRQRIARLNLRSEQGDYWNSDAPLYLLAGSTRVLDLPGCEAGRHATELQVNADLPTSALLVRQ